MGWLLISSTLPFSEDQTRLGSSRTNQRMKLMETAHYIKCIYNPTMVLKSLMTLFKPEVLEPVVTNPSCLSPSSKYKYSKKLRIPLFNYKTSKSQACAVC